MISTGRYSWGASSSSLYNNKWYLAFTNPNGGPGEMNIIISVISSRVGTKWEASGNTFASSSLSPSLCAYKDKLYVAFNSSVTYDNNLLVCNSLDGVKWEDANSTKQSTSRSPSLCVYKDKLYLAFVDTTTTHNILVISSSDGINWSGGNPTNQSTIDSPSLCVYKDKLYLAFVDDDIYKQIRVISSSDGINWDGGNSTNQSTIYAPSLYVYNGKLYLTFTNKDDSFLSLFHVNIPGNNTPDNDRNCASLSLYATNKENVVKSNVETHIPGMTYVGSVETSTKLIDPRVIITKNSSEKEIFIAFSGTIHFRDWIMGDATNIFATPFTDASNTKPQNGGNVGAGFLLEWKNVAQSSNPKKNILKSLEEVAKSMDSKDITVYVTGHSLGAAMAIISMYDICNTMKQYSNSKVHMINFGSPIVGDRDFTSLYKKIDNGNVLELTTMYMRMGDPLICANALLGLTGDCAQFLADVLKIQITIPKIINNLPFVPIKDSIYLPKGDCNGMDCHDIGKYIELLKEL